MKSIYYISIVYFILCSCGTTYSMTYCNGYILDLKGEVLGNYANGHIFDTLRKVKGYYANGYIYDKSYKIKGTCNNGFVKMNHVTNPLTNGMSLTNIPDTTEYKRFEKALENELSKTNVGSRVSDYLNLMPTKHTNIPT